MDIFLITILSLLLLAQYTIVVANCVTFNDENNRYTFKDLFVMSIPLYLYYQKISMHVNKMIESNYKKQFNTIEKRYKSFNHYEAYIKMYVNEDRNLLSKIKNEFSLDENDFLEFINKNGTFNRNDTYLIDLMKKEKLEYIASKAER